VGVEGAAVFDYFGALEGLGAAAVVDVEGLRGYG
jgi:hypothetical protein